MFAAKKERIVDVLSLDKNSNYTQVQYKGPPTLEQ